MNVSRVAKGGMMRTQTGTPYYACPEVWKDMPYDHRSDIWSAGCVLYEMIMKLPPFRAQTMKGLYAKVLSGKYDPLPQHYTQDMKNILKSCLQVRASERANCDKILRMPGLLNHLTSTLDEIQSMMPDQENLMKTIRMPRRMGEITERMPKPQYDQPAFKRTNSQPQMRSSEALDSESAKRNLISATKNGLNAKNGSYSTRNQSAVAPGTDSSKQTSSLNLGGNQVVEVESKSLIQKAHELYNIKNNEKKTAAYRTPDKNNNQQISLADRAARLNQELQHELPAIEEAADKENDTFAQGGPIAALQLAGKRREAQRKQRRESASQNSSRLQSNDRSGLRSAEPQSLSAQKDKYRMYREKNDNESIGIGNLAAAKLNNGMPPRTRLSYQPKQGEANTPGYNQSNKAADLIGHMNDKCSLPRIQSSRSNMSAQKPYGLHSRQSSRAKMLEIQNKAIIGGGDFSSQASLAKQKSR